MDASSPTGASTTPAAGAAAAPVVGVWRGPMRATTLGAVSLVSVFAFEAMAVTTAMPVVAQALDGLRLYGLAFGAAVAASVVGMVVAGIACDRSGPTLPFVGGATLFALGLLLAGTAPSMQVVVAGRVVQGLGVGLAIVTLYVLVDDYPSEVQPKVFAAFAAAWVVPALVGPALAGLLVDVWHWRAVFLVVLVVALPASVLVARRMAGRPATEPRPWTAADRRRVVAAVAAAVGALLLHLAGQAGAPRGAVLLVAGLVLVGASVRRLLPAGTMRMGRGLPAVVGLRGLGASAFLSAEVLVPLLLTTQRGLHPGAAGMVLTGGALGWSIGSWAQGRHRRAATTWLREGFTLVALGTAAVGTVLLPVVPLAVAVVGWVVAGAGMGVAIPTLSVQVLRLSPKVDQGGNVSSLQVADALASGACLAAVGTLVAVGGTTPRVFAGGLGLAVGVALLGAAVSRRAAPPEGASADR